MNDDEKTLSEQAELNDVLKNKIGIFIAIPNMASMINTAMALWFQEIVVKTFDSNCPYFFKVYMPNDLIPIEWARNQCVMEFLKEPYFKKLWFVDADMIPPFNAFDLLDFDAPLVSGMTYIWSSERFDDDSNYHPPLMKINAFDYRPDRDDFVSRLPSPDGRTFECDATGAACLVIKREVMEDMPEPWFRTPRDPYGRTLRGEDMDFTFRCKQRGHRPLYIPRVQFGHIKPLCLKQVCTYGMASMRAVIERTKGLSPEDAVKVLPEIRFPGEKVRDEAPVPKKLQILEGGKSA